MKHKRRHETERDEFEETRNSTLLTKNYSLLKWSDNLEMGTPNLFIPQQIADHIGSTPFCRFAISPRLDRVATMNFNRVLNVYTLNGSVTNHESSVQVLEDEFPEYCLLQFSECNNLLLSSRSSAQIDIFDHSGGYCYDIPLDTTSLNLDLRSAISCMQTAKNTSNASDDKYLDWLYVLQYNGQFSVFKIGRLSRYCKMWTTQLNIGLASSFTLIKEYNLLLVGAHYPAKSEVKPPGGLCSFRLIEGDPYLDPIRTLQDNTSWFKYLPFTSSNYAFISSMSISLTTPKKLLGVSTNGDLFLYDLPSTNVRTSIKYMGGPRPIQATFVDENEIAIIFNDGSLLKSSIENLQDAVIEFSPCDKFDGRSEIFTPSARELFILNEEAGNGVHREVVSERTFMAASIWFYTFWLTFKSLIGMAVGDSPSPLHMAKHSAKLSFELWYLPTRTLQQLLDTTLNDRDYEGAKRLADQYDSINMNIILKREWEDVCESDTVTTKDVTEILENIRDEQWIAEACASCFSSNFEAQKALAKLGLSQETAQTETRAHLLHNSRLLAACSNVEFYLEHREKSLLEIAQEFAKIGDIAGLQKLLERNFELLRPNLLTILSHLPTAMPPRKYSILLPAENGELKEIQRNSDLELDEIEIKICKENPSLMFHFNFGNSFDSSGEEDYLKWVRRHAKIIEEETGLYKHSIELLEVSKENDYEELGKDINQWKQFSIYVTLCSSVNETFAGFLGLSVEIIVSNISKITEEELLNNANHILSLIEFLVENESEIRKSLRPLLINSCDRSTKVLKRFKELRPSIFDKDLVTQCLCQSTITGKQLLDELRALSIYPDICSALRALLDLGVKPTFHRIFDSTTDSVVAHSILTQAVANMNVHTVEEWETLKDDVLQLSDSVYSKLVPREDVLQLLAKELLLNDALRTNSTLLASLLTLDKSGPKQSDGIKLGQLKSIEVLMGLSMDSLNEAVEKNDPSLDRSRFFATLARPMCPKQSMDQIKLLDAIDLMQELGSTIPPVSVRLCDPMQILQQMIDIGTNYKKGKSLAKLAVLFDIPTPVSTALSLAALAAIEHKDEECLAKYIAEIIKARDVVVVHKVCLQIIESSYASLAIEDVYACALLNCPNDLIADTLDIIENSRKKRKVPIVNQLDLSSEIMVDLLYSKVDNYTKRDPLSENCRFSLTNLTSKIIPSKAASIWAYESSSVALSLALMEQDENYREWTSNDTLLRYEKALKHYFTKISPEIAEKLPPKLFIEKYNKTHGTDTPLDRIELQGVNRERFVTDPAYREDSLDGLAMMEDDAIFADAVTLAEQFHVDEWKLHMTSLENALTTCTTAEAKRILKARGHLSKLRTNINRFHVSLRKNVLPLIETNELLIAYLSLFADDQPEKLASPTLKKILEKKRDLKAKKLLTDTNYLTEIIITMPDKFIIALAEGLRKYEVGIEACENASRQLLNGTNIRPPASVIAISTLLGNDETAVIELIASKSLDEEILYLKESLIILEATPNSSETLIKTIKERLDLLSMPVEMPAASTQKPQEPASFITNRRRH